MDLGILSSLFSSIGGGNGINQSLMAGGTLLSAYGAYQKGAGTAAAYNFNAGVATNNAALTAQQGNFAASLAYNRGNRVIGQAVANYGASGVTMDGSPLDVLADSTRNVISDTLMTAVPYANRAAAFGVDAALDKNGAGNARTSSYFAMGDDLAKGALRLRGGSGSNFNFSGSGDGSY